MARIDKLLHARRAIKTYNTCACMTDDVSNPQTYDMPATWTGELKALLWLGVPMGLAQVVSFFVYFIDLLMIARLTPADVAAASLGSVYFFALWMLGAGPVMAVSPMVSQALGGDTGERADVRRTVRMSIWAIAILTPVIAIICFASKPISLALGQDELVAEKAYAYTLMLIPGWFFALAVMALRNFLAAIERTWVPLALAAIGTSLNAGLNWVFIFGNLGMPAMGLTGAGIASSLTYFLTFLIFMAYIRFDKLANSFQIFTRFFRSDFERLKGLTRLGWPISVTTMFEGMLFNAAVFIVGVIGVTQQAAYQIGLNVASLAFMFPFGLSMAGATRMGLAAGARNRPAMTRVALTVPAVCVFAIGLAAIPIALFPDRVAAFYMDASKPGNGAVIAMVITFLPIAAGFMFFDAVQVAANQLLRGLKDVNWAMALTGISYWVVGFPVAYWLGLHTPVGAKGVWYGLMAGLSCASILLGGRLIYLLRRPSDLKACVN